MVSVEVDIKEAVRDLDRAKAIFQNQRKYRLYRTMADMLLRTYWGETFDKEGERRGHPRWAPLNPIYSMYKASRGRSTKPLILTGHLRGSGKVLRETSDSLVFGTQVPYAGYHQEGDGVPEREFLFYTSQDLKEMGNFLGRMLQVILNKEVGV